MASMEIISVLLGVVVGAMSALTGTGGAVIGVPLLVMSLHLTVSQAGPIALLAVALAATLGTFLGLRARLVRYRAALFIAAVGAILSPLGLWAARSLPDSLLTGIFASILFYIALHMWRQTIRSSAASELDTPQRRVPCSIDKSVGRFVWTRPCVRALALSGVGTGFLSGLLGVGGGFILVPALKKATDLPMQSLTATSLAVVALISITGVFSASISGHVQWIIAIPFALGAVMGMFIGRKVVSLASAPALEKSFALISLAVAVVMALRLAR